MSAGVLITGRQGQLATECRLHAPGEATWEAAGRPQFDLEDPEPLAEHIRRARPAAVLHLAAWTAVDEAEAQIETAMRINGEATAAIAAAAADAGARLVYVSTDYVFPGTAAAQRPWREDDEPDPVNAYGRSKLAGERAVLRALGDRGHVVRTGWLYGRSGRNFARTMLRHMLAGKALKVVDDQRGGPTWAGGLARALWGLATAARGAGCPRILHYADGGVISWYDFASAIREEALAAGAEVDGSTVTPCGTDEYPTAAARPAWSPLAWSAAWSSLGIEQRPWRENLRAAMPRLLADVSS